MSRFVSGGTDEAPTERDDAWRVAQQEIEAKRKTQVKIGEQEGGKSLFETLAANKAAKQDAFEDAARLRNQFRSLDEDEVDFLDSINESTRVKEAEVKRETREQLEAFRKQQEEAEKVEETAEVPEAVQAWSFGARKRKKAREAEVLGGVKLRRTSSAKTEMDQAQDLGHTSGARSPSESVLTPAAETTTSPQVTLAPAKTEPAASTTTPKTPALGLAAYSSDEDE